MIPKGSIKRMFLDSHKLYGIVSGFAYNGDNLFCKIMISANFLFRCSHSDMRFVDNRSREGRSKIFTTPIIGFLWLPNLSIKYFSLVILDHTVSILRDPFSASAFPMNRKLVQVSMFECIRRQKYLPVAHSIDPLHHEFVLLFPFSKNADNKNVICIWSPFPKDPGIFVTVKSIVIMPHCEITKCTVSDQ